MDQIPSFPNMEGVPTMANLDMSFLSEFPPEALPPPGAQVTTFSMDGVDLSGITSSMFMYRSSDVETEWDNIGPELDSKWWKEENKLPPWGRVKWINVNKIPHPCNLVAWAAAIFASDIEWELVKKSLYKHSVVKYKVYVIGEGFVEKEKNEYNGNIKKQLKKWIKISNKKLEEIISVLDKMKEINDYIDDIINKREKLTSEKDKDYALKAKMKSPWRHHGDSYLFTSLWAKAGLTESARLEIEKVPYNIFCLAAYWHLEAVNASGGLF